MAVTESATHDVLWINTLVVFPVSTLGSYKTCCYILDESIGKNGYIPTWLVLISSHGVTSSSSTAGKYRVVLGQGKWTMIATPYICLTARTVHGMHLDAAAGAGHRASSLPPGSRRRAAGKAGNPASESQILHVSHSKTADTAIADPREPRKGQVFCLASE